MHLSVPCVFLVQFIILSSKCQSSLQSPHCYMSEVHKGTNKTICHEDYFEFPNIWTDVDNYGDKLEDAESNFTVCCPASTGMTKVDERPFWWPDETHSGLSRAILNCHPANIPGIETIKFLYYANNNQDTEDYTEIFVGSRKSLRISRFVKGAPLKVVIHGFMSSPFVGPTKALRGAYSQLPKVINIIAVQWEALANFLTASDSICYNIASRSTKLVGKRTAELIDFLISENMVNLADVHILGHSLGAHCAGFTGKFLKSGKLSRITGFDPARPNFDQARETDRIHYTDAHFVDIIHTATKDWKLLGLVSLGLAPFPVGLQTPVGHADFYPNHGTHQPGCTTARPILPVLCSHSRAYYYYAESILYGEGEPQFYSKECKDFAEIESGDCSGDYSVAMGEYTPRYNHTRKMYYLATNKKSPFVLDWVPII